MSDADIERDLKRLLEVAEVCHAMQPNSETEDALQRIKALVESLG